MLHSDDIRFLDYDLKMKSVWLLLFWLIGCRLVFLCWWMFLYWLIFVLLFFNLSVLIWWMYVRILALKTLWVLVCLKSSLHRQTFIRTWTISPTDLEIPRSVWSKRLFIFAHWVIILNNFFNWKILKPIISTDSLSQLCSTLPVVIHSWLNMGLQMKMLLFSFCIVVCFSCLRNFFT